MRRLIEPDPSSVVALVSIDDLDLADQVAACRSVAFRDKRDLRPATLRDLWANCGDAR